MTEHISEHWQKFLQRVVTAYRDRMDALSEEERYTLLHLLPTYRLAQNLVLYEPCQIVVFTFSPSIRTSFLVLHDPSHPDCEFFSYEGISDLLLFEKNATREHPFWLKAARSLAFFAGWHGRGLSFSEEGALAYFEGQEARSSPDYVMNELFGSAQDWLRESLIHLGTRRIQETTGELRQDAMSITQKEIRTRVLESTGAIEVALRQMRRLDPLERSVTAIQEEIKGVRTLIGATKEFQEFRVLTSEVDRLSREHVSKDVFDETVRRLDQQLEALTTRFNDLRETKFWSRRTLIDIALGLIAAISTIYAAKLARLLPF